MLDSSETTLSSDEQNGLVETVNPAEETSRERGAGEMTDFHENQQSSDAGSYKGCPAQGYIDEPHNDNEGQNKPERPEPTRFTPQVLLAGKSIQKPSSFAQLVRTWETYMSDETGDEFAPLEVFEQLNLCGAVEGLARLTGPTGQYDRPDGKLLEPYVFRHTFSTPLRHTPSILDDDDEDEPPPVGLEILNRSRSTPLSMSANSAFGTTLRTMPYLSTSGDRSAFTLPPYRLKPSISSDSVARHTTFNPIKYDKEMETESTSIEVMDIPTRKSPSMKPLNDVSLQHSIRKSTASRAAKFLLDVRNLRRRRMKRGGRENPARPSPLSDGSGGKTDVADEETISSKSSTNRSEGKLRSLPASKTRNRRSEVAESKSPPGHGRHDGAGKNTNSVEVTSYQQLDSDQDEDGEPFRRTDISMNIDSPSTIPSPVYHQMADDDQQGSRTNRVRIQVSNSAKDSIFLGNTGASPYVVASPEPAQMARDASTLTPQSEDSPGTSGCSTTTYTSGHTTQASATTSSSGYTSQLSSISETDREVMEANKAGTLLRQDRDLSSSSKDNALRKSIPLSSSRNTRYAEYIELGNSPVSLRDGANVPAERFFRLEESQGNDKRGFGRWRSSSSLRKSTCQSPTTVSSSSMNTNSSASSASDEPPTFVSYLDRKTTSDLTSLRESVEASSSRAGEKDREQRESSPAELLGYSDVIFEEAQAPLDTTSKKPRPIWPTKGLQFGRRVRSLPPRSPLKGARTPTTPPPRAGNESMCVSPPRNIVNHRIDSNVSRPFVLRTTASTRLMPGHKVSTGASSPYRYSNYTHIPGEGVDQGAQEVVRVASGYETSRNYYMALPRGSSPVGLQSKTYDEHSIEILKTDSKEESSPTLVSSEKGTSNEIA